MKLDGFNAQMLNVVVVNAWSAGTVASFSSDCDQWLASTESQWEHCCCRGRVRRSIWYVVGLVDVSMKGLGVDRPTARLGIARPGVLECYLAFLSHVQRWHCDLWQSGQTQVRDPYVKKPQSYEQNHAT